MEFTEFVKPLVAFAEKALAPGEPGAPRPTSGSSGSSGSSGPTGSTSQPPAEDLPGTSGVAV
jgi:hypothetical protein